MANDEKFIKKMSVLVCKPGPSTYALQKYRGLLANLRLSIVSKMSERPSTFSHGFNPQITSCRGLWPFFIRIFSSICPYFCDKARLTSPPPPPLSAYNVHNIDIFLVYYEHSRQGKRNFSLLTHCFINLINKK